MADECYFELCAVGEPVNIWELYDLLQRKGAYRKNGIRWIELSGNPRFCEVNDQMAYLSGTCKWSVHSTMINPWSDEFHTIVSASELLKLTVEIYSDGSCFQEHYIVDHGEVKEEDYVEYTEYAIADMNTDELCECIKENNLIGKHFLKYLDEETLILGAFENWDYQIGGI